MEYDVEGELRLFLWLQTKMLLNDAGKLTVDEIEELKAAKFWPLAPLEDEDIEYSIDEDDPAVSAAFVIWWNWDRKREDRPLTLLEIRDKDEWGMTVFRVMDFHFSEDWPTTIEESDESDVLDPGEKERLEGWLLANRFNEFSGELDDYERWVLDTDLHYQEGQPITDEEITRAIAADHGELNRALAKWWNRTGRPGAPATLAEIRAMTAPGS